MKRLAVGAITLTALAVAGCGSSGGGAAPTPSTNASSTPAPAAATASTVAPKPAATSTSDSAADRKAAVTAFDHAVAALPKGSVSAAAVNLTTGAKVSAGSKGGQWMASTYKLFLTEALLNEYGHVDEDDAEAALEHSDNKAGYDLFEDLGSTSGTIDAIHDFGLTETDLPGNAFDPTFMTTSATDWIKILRNLVGKGKLTADERKYVLSLMSQVEPDQRWGVGAAATGTFVNKNGWESVDDSNSPPEPTDGGRWIVNSVGIVNRDGDRLLMAVLTQHNDGYDDGKDLVAKLAKLAAAAVTT